MTALIKRNSLYETTLECCDSILTTNPLEGYLHEFRIALKQLQPLKRVNVDDDEALLRFLRHTNFDIPAAVKSVKKNEKFIEENSEILETPFSACEYVYSKGIIDVLKERDEEGRRVLLIRGKNWTPETVSLEIMAMAAWYILDELLLSVETQVNGIVCILDMSDVGMFRAAKMATYFTLNQVVRMVNFYQGGYPVKIKAIHSVNTLKIALAMYTGFKYLLKEKMRARLHFHSQGPKVLQKYFNKNILPQSVAGNVPDHLASDLPHILKKIIAEQRD